METDDVKDALAASEARLRLALEASLTGMWTWEPHSDAVTWSAESYRIHGLQEGSFANTGAAFFQLVHPEDRARVEKTVRAAIEEGRTYESEFRIMRPDGTIVWVANRGRASPAAASRPLTVLGTITDITLRKREEEIRRLSEERLRLALEASNAGVWDWDIGGGQLHWSAESYMVYGLTPSGAPLAFADWARNVERADLAGLQQAFTETLDGRRTEFREIFRVHHPERGLRWILSVGRLIKTVAEQPLRIAGLNFDITEYKRMEEALKEADRQKDRFLAMVSHELRNPLASIRSAASLLADQDAAPDQMAGARGILQRQVAHMAALLDDLLDIARVTQGKLELKIQRVPLRELVETAIESARPLIEGKKHRLSVDLPPGDLWCAADGKRLAQVLSNLLANAAKYTNPGGTIGLSCRANQQGLEFCVSDNGIGLAPQSLEQIFRMFAQVEASSAHSEGGLGIGLALVKGIVELHGGVVEAQSGGLDCGSLFRVRLPAHPVLKQGPVIADDSAANAAAFKQRILVVDDNADNADALAMLLESYGQEVSVARGGLNAIELADAFHPELAIVDIGMPDIDGYSVARALRQRSWAKRTRLIALTGWGQDKDKSRAREAGFDQHLTKPVDPDELRALLRSGPRRDN
jgi:PAS domain S-box-containing protein